MTASPEPGALPEGGVRAGVLAFLSSQKVGDFTEIARALNIPNNSLSSHLYRLEAAGWVRLEKGFLGRKPRTRVHLTDAGLQEWKLYLDRFGEAPPA